MKKNIASIIGLLALIATGLTGYAQKPSEKLLNPKNHTLVFIDHQSQMAFATTSIPIVELRNNVAIVAGASKIFKVPTVITTVARNSFSGPLFQEIVDFYPEAAKNAIDRTTMNTWEDVNAYKAITGKGNKKIVLAGLWTEVCIVGPALSAIADGYEVYFISDACGGVSPEAHNKAVERMIQAGAQPMTAIQYALELQRDWARNETYDPLISLMKKYGGAYGTGIQYAKEMFNGKESH